MTKILVHPSKISEIDKLLNMNIDGLILGIDKFSINCSFTFSLDKVKSVIDLIRQKDKEVFINLNKLIYNEEIPELIKVLEGLSKENINGILFEDITIFNLNKDMNLELSLGWYQNHFGTNYHTCNYWYKEGCEYAYLANELTLDEIIKIKNNTNIKLLTTMYGYNNMVTSSRSLITNYFLYNNINDENKQCYVWEKDPKECYPIIEMNGETNIFDSKIFSAGREFGLFIENNIDYVVINGYLSNQYNFIPVVDLFIQIRDDFKDQKLIDNYLNKIEELSNGTTNGFLYNPTIYKVKNNEE